MDPKKWFERQFTFAEPVGLFPCIVARLAGTPARLEDLVAGLEPKVLTRRLEGRWSIQENIGHLLDLDVLHDSRLDDYLDQAEVLKPADLENRRTHEADHNQREVAQLLEGFRAEREAFVLRLNDLTEDVVARTALHPRLNQPMRLLDMTIFTADHDDHHIATIMHLLRVLARIMQKP